jgi:hypothetical protein
MTGDVRIASVSWTSMTRTRVPLLFAMIALGACASDRITRPATPTASSATRIYTVATDVVYYLDGKEITSAQVEAMDPKSIHSVEVIKGESARRMLGDRAAYGVVLITSKTVPASR